MSLFQEVLSLFLKLGSSALVLLRYLACYILFHFFVHMVLLIQHVFHGDAVFLAYHTQFPLYKIHFFVAQCTKLMWLSLCDRNTWKAMRVIRSYLFTFRKSLLCYLETCYLSIFTTQVIVLKTPICFHLICWINCDRFTSDVKIKSISIVGGADGTSPSKMRA